VVSRKPVLICDTSGINLLTDEMDSRALAARLVAAYHTCLTGSNISELAANTKPSRRNRLLDTCQQLQVSGVCIDPFNWIVEKHIKAFEQNPRQYDWKQVDVRNREIEYQIIRRKFFNDELPKQENEDADKTEESFEDIFCSMRPELMGFSQTGRSVLLHSLTS
jgi:hypothetical protein